MKKILALLISGLLTSACSSNKLADYQAEQPQLVLEQFLNGKIHGYGLVEDYSQRVTRRFNFAGVASWQESQGRFAEQISYSDGKQESRVWHIVKIDQHYYQATAPDVIGVATIKMAGNAMNWRYTMDVKVDEQVYRLNFDDWMYLLPDGQIINRNYFKKFGFTVGELTLFMQKESS